MKLKVNKNQTVSAEKYLNKIRSYLKDIISNLKKSNVSKIQLTITFHFICSTYNDEECVLYSKSSNRKSW